MCGRFPRKFDFQTSHKPLNCVLGLIFVVNIKFPRATYHTVVPSTEELYCFNSGSTTANMRVTFERRRLFNARQLACSFFSTDQTIAEREERLLLV